VTRTVPVPPRPSETVRVKVQVPSPCFVVTIGPPDGNRR